MKIDQDTPLDIDYFNKWDFDADASVGSIHLAHLTLKEMAHSFSARAATIVIDQIIEDVTTSEPTLSSDQEGTGIVVSLIDSAAYLHVALDEIYVGYSTTQTREAVAALLARIDNHLALEAAS